MTVRQDLAGVVNNDLQYTFALVYNDLPLNLAGYTVTVTVKASQTAPDTSGTAYGVGTGLTVVSAVAGRFTLSIPHAATSAAGSLWYRVDVSNGSGTFSAMCGTLTLMSALRTGYYNFVNRYGDGLSRCPAHKP